MKKRMKILAVLFTLAIAFTACGKKETAQSDAGSLTINTDQQDTEDEKTADDETAEDLPAGATASDEVAKDTAEGSQKVYFANDNADGYESATIEGEITPESVLQLLIDKQMVSSDVTVISCNTTTVDGKKSVDLDLSSNILTDLSSKGTTGETMEMGSICNTFLSAFGCEQISITADGQDIVTEHGDYSGYMTAY